MPAYVASPFRPSPELLVSGKTSYFWGSYNEKTGPTTGTVIQSKTNGTTTATLKIQILSGNIPVNGSLITVVGSSNSANFNVTNAVISSVTSVPDPVTGLDTGIYTLTVTITSTATPTTFTADAAQFIIPQPEVAEALVAGASIEKAAPFNNPNLQQGKSLSVTTTFPSLPTSVIISLQGADFNIDSEYVTIAQVAAVSGGTTTQTHWNSEESTPLTAGVENPGGVNLLNYRFYRILVGTVTGGTSPTIISKIEP